MGLAFETVATVERTNLSVENTVSAMKAGRAVLIKRDELWTLTISSNADNETQYRWLWEITSDFGQDILMATGGSRHSRTIAQGTGHSRDQVIAGAKVYLKHRVRAFQLVLLDATNEEESVDGRVNA